MRQSGSDPFKMQEADHEQILRRKSAPRSCFEIIGTGTRLLLGAIRSEGTTVGARSLIYKLLAHGGIYVGIPERRLENRSQEILKRDGAYTKARRYKLLTWFYAKKTLFCLR